MKFSKLAAALTLATISAGALAGGPLYIHEKTMQPYKWDTSKGAIPVYTDGGMLIKDKDGNDVQSFTVLEAGSQFNQDLTLPDGTVLPQYVPLDRDYTFLTIEQANAVTANAIKQWSDVETSTFEMTVQGTIFEKTGIADVNETNVDEIYGAENGYGFWVNYDTDGQILEQYFGIQRDQVLGIAFPEWADEETGEITEATALMNGWFVDVSDTEGKQVGGVFTHEFGHAINMSHSQANGHLAYMPASYRPMYDGVPGCDGVNTFVGSPSTGARAEAHWIETMFPFIDVRSIAGIEQSSVNITDDIVNISDLYPTADYKTKYGSISGTLYTKEGIEYSGINMVLRNLDNPYEDVITQQSGNMSQGLLGPDGKFTINGLTPGARYALYIDTIKAGGYPTAQTNIVSEAEYWNEGESSDPAQDSACKMTEIVVQGGETKQVDMHFNGYNDGISYAPLVGAFVMDQSKNGKSALGITQGGIPFIYDSTKKEVIDTATSEGGYALLKATNATMNKTATKAGVVADFNGNGIDQAAVWDIKNDKITPLQDLTGNTCHLSSQQGVSSNSVWEMDDTGSTVVGTTRFPYDGGDRCAEGQGHQSYQMPTVWNTKTGKATILDEGIEIVDSRYGSTKEVILTETGRRAAWIRADRVSGNGKTITGTTNGFGQVAWVDGKLVDTNGKFGAADSSVISADGRYVAFTTLDSRRAAQGVQIWDTQTDKLENIGSLRWCDDVPFIQRWTNYCELGYDHETLVSLGAGHPRMTVLDATEDFSMITARAGGILSGGFVGAIYMEGLGWMSTKDFFAKQGVVEAKNFLSDNIFGLSANGSEMMAGIAGATVTIDVDANKAFVCDNGVDMELSFPKQVVAAVKKGAEFGRCAHLND